MGAAPHSPYLKANRMNGRLGRIARAVPANRRLSQAVRAVTLALLATIQPATSGRPRERAGEPEDPPVRAGRTPCAQCGAIDPGPLNLVTAVNYQVWLHPECER